MRATYKQLQYVTNSLIDTNKYNISFGVVPGSGALEIKNVCLKCFEVGIPGESIDTIEVNIHGHKVIHRGLKKQSQSFSASFYNNGSSWSGLNSVQIPMDSDRLFRDWMNKVSNQGTQQSAPKSLISTALNSYVNGQTGQALNNLGNRLGIDSSMLNVKTTKKDLYSCPEVIIDIYGQSNLIQNRFIFVNVWPTNIDSISLGHSGILASKVTFAFDYFYNTDVLATKALSAIDLAEQKLARITRLA